MKKRKKSLVGWVMGQLVCNYRKHRIMPNCKVIYVFPKKNNYYDKKVRITIEEI